MANGNASGAVNGDVTGDTNGSVPGGPAAGMEDTVEFRVMMAYAQRRRPGGLQSPPKEGADTGATAPQIAQGDEGVQPKKKKKKKKKKSMIKSVKSLFSCVRPPTDDQPEEGGICQAPQSRMEVYFRSMDSVEDGEAFGDLAGRLTTIADGVSFTAGDLETDGDEDAVTRLVALLLREHGDKLNEEVLKDSSLAKELFGSYSFYQQVISAFLRKMGLTPDPGPATQTSPKAQIALTCEVTSRLSAVGSHPMNRLLGFGARYLHDHYSSWVNLQGGYEEAFESENDEEVH